MKLLKHNFQQGWAELQIETLDDLWYLSSLVEPGDSVRAKTTRKIKMGSGERSEVVKKTVTLSITVETVEFTETVLRVKGKVEDEMDDIPQGSYHTISLEPGESMKLTKPQWLSFQKKKLHEACEEKKGTVLMVILDREEAFIAVMKREGYDILTHLKGDVAKKGDERSETGNFYQDLSKIVLDYVNRYDTRFVIVASPAFWKEDFLKAAPEELQKKVRTASVSSCDRRAFTELLKRDEVQQLLRDEHAAQEIGLVEEAFARIAQQSKVMYGFDEVREAVQAGAVETLLVTDRLIHEKREEDTFHALEEMMRMTEQMNGEVHLITTGHEGGKKLHSLGGVVAMLRYDL